MGKDSCEERKGTGLVLFLRRGQQGSSMLFTQTLVLCFCSGQRADQPWLGRSLPSPDCMGRAGGTVPGVAIWVKGQEPYEAIWGDADLNWNLCKEWWDTILIY